MNLRVVVASLRQCRILLWFLDAGDKRAPHAELTGVAKIREKHARGEKLDTEVPSSMMRCVCGEMFDSHDPEGSLPHRRHIYAAHGGQKR
jgi:hypothetical protein